MYYDALRNPSTDEKLLISSSSSGTLRPVFIEGNEIAIEEETAATIQTIHQKPSIISLQTSKSEGSTPLRKIIPTSSVQFKQQQRQQQDYLLTNSNITKQGEQNDSNVSSGSLYSTSKLLPTKGVESKLLSMWHNVKYGWSGKLKSTFSEEQPVWLLGKCYHRKFSLSPSTESIPQLFTLNVLDDPVPGSLYPSLNAINEHATYYSDVPQELGEDVAESQQINENPWLEGIEGFKRDFYTRIWMTYRREFPILNGSNYTSDCGWGCMLRSGQMLLAQALIYHFLGRSWRYNPEISQLNTYEDHMHRKIIRWFGDSSSKSNPFSIHTLVQLGESMGKKPGDWYGPASVSYLMRQAFKNAAQENADFDNLVLYVAKDCTIYLQDVEAECQVSQCFNKKPEVPWCKLQSMDDKTSPTTKLSSAANHLQWKSLIILIPLRLGSDKLNPDYAHCLKSLLSTEYCVGIIGGRPKHSLYFVGFQEDKLIHLDPHYCQEMVDISQHDFPLHTFHCKSPRKLKLSKLDPSCCIGFYLKTRTDLDNFIETIQMYLLPMNYIISKGNISDKSVELSSTQQQQHQMNPNTILSSSLNDRSSHLCNDRKYYPLFNFSREDHGHHERDLMQDKIWKNNLQQNQQQKNHWITNASIDNAESECDCDEFVML